MIFGETQVTFLPGCTGKKISSKTLISIFFSWGGGNPLPLKITSLTLLVHEETLIKDKMSFLIHRGMLLMFLMFVNAGIEWYRRFHIQPLFLKKYEKLPTNIFLWFDLSSKRQFSWWIRRLQKMLSQHPLLG